MIDAIDRQIVRTLLHEGRISVRELADRVALSTSATSERLRRLERRGVIEGYRAVLSLAAVGRPFDAVIGVRAARDTDHDALETWLVAQRCIVEALHLTGEQDYIVRARCRDAHELDELLMAMKRDAGVAETETRIVLRSLPVDPDLV